MHSGNYKDSATVLTLTFNVWQIRGQGLQNVRTAKARLSVSWKSGVIFSSDLIISRWCKLFLLVPSSIMRPWHPARTAGGTCTFCYRIACNCMSLHVIAMCLCTGLCVYVRASFDVKLFYIDHRSSMFSSGVGAFVLHAFDASPYTLCFKSWIHNLLTCDPHVTQMWPTCDPHDLQIRGQFHAVPLVHGKASKTDRNSASLVQPIQCSPEFTYPSLG